MMNSKFMTGHLVAQKVLDSIWTFHPLSKQWTLKMRFPECRHGNFSTTTGSNPFM